MFRQNSVILAIVLKRPLRPALGRPVLKWAAIKQPFHRRKTYKEQKKDKCNQFTLFSVHRYRVSHFEMDFMNWLWQIKICKFDLLWRWFWNTEIGNFWVPQLFSKKSNISWPQQPPTERVPDISEKLDFWWSILWKGASIGHIGARDDLTRGK